MTGLPDERRHATTPADPSAGSGSETTSGSEPAADPGRDSGRVGSTVAAWVLRATVGAASAATIGVVAAWSAPSSALLVALALAGVWTVLRPGSHAATALIALAAFVVLVNDPGLSAWAAGAVLGVHAVHLSAALAAVVPMDTKVEFAALRPSLRRFAVVQAASQALVVLALLVVP
ncbi:hypothetical protein [Phytoactinopolyspora limicola]|uniref:hypothetical protein n=1 Tax=Phytoactinopolyspora limicola TaxID=2715536 RepID=UPI00140C6128|nr:hypothetical protein [Phytoactinopolyspora limicola]